MKGIKWFILLLAFVVLLCTFPVAAMADEAKDEAVQETVPIVNPEGDTLINAGYTVYNNGGIVYNNGGVVFNNGGVVYNNGGITYNNTGTAYNNAGTVYNNAGTVFDNGGKTVTNGNELLTTDPFPVTMAGDYSHFATFDGFIEAAGTYFIAADESCTITPVENFRISEATSSSGELTENEDGSYTLSGVNAPVELSLKFAVAAPQFTPEGGSYGQDTTVSISGADGADIYYTLNGDTPTEESAQYKEPIELTEGIILSAISVYPDVEASPVSIAQYALPKLTAPEFDNVAEGYKQPKAKGITLDNPGLAEAVIEGVALEGESVESFTLNSTEGKSLEAGALDDSTWTIRPAADLAKGAYSVKIVVTLDSGNELVAYVSFKVT